MSKFRYTTITAVVIANMVGTGVFTSLGFQLLEIRSGFVLLMLWAVGGLIALCGAMTYAELGAAMPRSGGEYNFLTRIYHPAVGFVSGWVSATVGFAGPTALAAMTFAAYGASAFFGEPNPWLLKILACALIIVLTLVVTTSIGFIFGFFVGKYFRPPLESALFPFHVATGAVAVVRQSLIPSCQPRWG